MISGELISMSVNLVNLELNKKIGLRSDCQVWSIICQVAGSSPSPESLFFPSFFLVFISHLSFSMTVTGKDKV